MTRTKKILIAAAVVIVAAFGLSLVSVSADETEPDTGYVPPSLIPPISIVRETVAAPRFTG